MRCPFRNTLLLFLVTGGVYPELERKLSGYPYKTPRVVFRNLRNGKFEELIEAAGPGVAAPHSSRGCAFGDFDNDGDLDVLIVNLNEPPSLLRNDVRGNHHWLKVKLAGTQSNRSAIGARVLLRYGGKQQVQEVVSQSSYCSSNDPRLHFGLGTADTADLEVRWPSVARQTFRKLTADPTDRHPRRFTGRRARSLAGSLTRSVCGAGFSGAAGDPV